MKTLLKYLGVIILLIGVGILAIPAFTDLRSNQVLLLGLGVVFLGFFAHIFLYKKIG